MEAQAEYQTMASIEGYFSDMTLEEFVEFLEVNNVSYAKRPRFPPNQGDYLEVIPNDRRFKVRHFNRMHEQISP